MGDSNRVRLSYYVESTWAATNTAGTSIPDSTALTDIRFTGEGLVGDTNITPSEEIRSDRQIVDIIRTSIRASGNINFEWTAGTFDVKLQVALFSAGWSSSATVTGTTISASATNNRFLDSGNGFTSPDFDAGQWVKSSGFATANNNGYWKIVTRTGNGEIRVAGKYAITTEAAGNSVTIKRGSQIVNGTTANSFGLCRQDTDLSNIYSLFIGMMIDQFSSNVTADQILKGSVTYMGKRQLTTAPTTPTYTTANANEVLEAIDHIPHIMEGYPCAGDAAANTAYGIPGIEVAYQISNNLRSRAQIGTLGPVSIGVGKFGLTGTLRNYFIDLSLINKYLGYSSSALAVAIQDSAGTNAYVAEWPKIKYTAGKHVAGGQDQDIIADMSFSAFRHGTEGITMRVVRWP